MDPVSLSFIRFHCILLDSVLPSSEFLNFYKLKRGDLISGGNQCCRKFELFGSPFCISILKVLRSQILHHSIDFNAFCLIQEYLSQTFKIWTNSSICPNFKSLRKVLLNQAKSIEIC